MAIVKSTLGLINSEVQPSSFDFSRTTVGTRVNNIGLIETVPANKIRQDYHPNEPGNDKGWLLEETSTNICLQSSDFSTTWVEEGVGLVNTATKAMDPAGVMNSALSLESSGGATAGIKQAIAFTNGNAHTVSIFVKQSQVPSFNYLELADGVAGSEFSQIFDLSNGAVSNATGTATNAKITSYPNGWYRCEVTVVPGLTSSELYVIPRNDDSNGAVDTTTVGDSVFLWGAQVEALSYATSYIATTAAPETRAADIASTMTSYKAYNWTVGFSMFIEYSSFGQVGSATPIFHYQDMNNENFISLYNDNSVRLTRDQNDQLGIVAPAITKSTGLGVLSEETVKFAMTIEPNRFNVAQNAVLATDSAFPYNDTKVPMNMDGSNYTIKFFDSISGNRGSGHIKTFRFFPNKLTDNELKLQSRRDGIVVGSNPPFLMDQILDNQVTESKIIDGAVTSDKIAVNSIGTEHLKLDIIVAEDIANNAISVAELQDNAVIESKIADDAVTAVKLANNAVATASVVDGAITGEKVGISGQVNKDIMYFDGAANGGVGRWQVLHAGTDGHFLRTTSTGLEWAEDGSSVQGSNLPSTQLGTGAGSDVVGTIAVPTLVPASVSIIELDTQTDGSVGQVLAKHTSGNLEFIDMSAGDPAMGGDISGNASTASIIANAVTSVKLEDHVSDNNNRAVSTNHIKDLNITEDKLAALSVTNGKIANDAITVDKIADNAVVADNIVNLTITGGKIADSAITLAKLGVSNAGTTGQVLTKGALGTLTWADDTSGASDPAVGGDVTGTISNISVTWSGIPDNTITSSMIAPGVIVAQDIAANAINGTHLQMGSDVAGDILYYDGTNYTRLGVGSNDQVLTVSSGSPAWVSGASGGVSAAQSTATAVTMAVALG